MATTTSAPASPISVALGTESQGDAKAQFQVKDTPDAAMDRVMGAAVRLLGSTEATEAVLLDALCDIAMAWDTRQAWSAVHKARQLLDTVREQELAAVRADLDGLYLFPFRGAEGHSPFIGEMLRRFDGAIDRANKTEGRIAEVTNLRQAVDIGHRLTNSRIGRQITEATAEPARKGGPKERTTAPPTNYERREALAEHKGDHAPFSAPRGNKGRRGPGRHS